MPDTGKSNEHLGAELEAARARIAELEASVDVRSIVDASQDWIWSIDLQGIHTFSNPAIERILGYPLAQLLGKPSFGLMHEDDRAHVQREFPRWIAEKRGWRGLVVRWRHRDGSWRHLESSAVPVLDDQEAIVGFRGVDRDITERIQAEEERRSLEARLQQSQKLESLGVLASGLAHDFNNLLVGIFGNMDLALMYAQEGTRVHDCLSEARTAAQRAADLIDQMLAYAGKGKASSEVLDLNALVEEMASLLKSSVSKKTTIRFALQPDLPPIEGDPTQLRQIVMNVITNAAQAIGDEPGEITLTTDVVDCERPFVDRLRPDGALPEGSCVRLRISDTGLGISDDEREKIFDPFYTTKPRGTGLGLSAVHGIVRSHGGGIRVESRLGAGSTFSFFFPAALETLDDVVADVIPDDWTASGTILIVDDEEMVRRVAAKAVKGFGFDVLTAADGKSGLEVFREHQDTIDCVLLDLKMPAMDGEETFAELRRIRQDLPVILCSGFSQDAATERFAGKGLAGFVQKPFGIATLKGKLREVLGPRA